MTDPARLDPTDRPPLQPEPLIRALAEFDVEWVLCGSQVLALHGADLQPNDLDVVPCVSFNNLKRVARCLDHLDAVAAYLDGWGGERGTLEACRNWRPTPATADHLDWLFVTRWGMLDIVIEHADPFETLMQDASQRHAGATPFWCCNPRRVLTALERRSRKKDARRRAIYQQMRRQFGMPDLD